MDIRDRIKRSRYAPVLALPTRVGLVGKYDVSVMRRSVRWLASSREATNFTYSLTIHNVDQLAWFVSGLTGEPYDGVNGYLNEVLNDESLATHIRQATSASAYSRLADLDAGYARRIGWYAIIRALKPHHVVETGVDKGLGSCVIAAALIRNAEDGVEGRLTAVDINPNAGYLVAGPYAGVVDLVFADSLDAIAQLDEPVDIFLHDSDHSSAHEAAELHSIVPHLAPGALVMSDNSHASSVLSEWARDRGQRFCYFHEQPQDHWYPGAGIGAAYWREETQR